METRHINNIDNEQIKSIPDILFFGCNKLTRLEFKNSLVNVIPPGLFNDCTSLEKIRFGNNQLSEIPDGLFDHCPEMSSVYFEKNQLCKIPKGLFHNCTKLFSINFSHNQLSEIPEGLFDNCPKLISIIFGHNQLSEIPEGLFNNCSDLSIICFDNNQLSKIPEGLFHNCPKLFSIIFGHNQLSEIPEGLFHKCPELKDISFNNNQLLILQDRIFDKCTKLQLIRFSNNHLAKIPDGLFDKCSDLSIISFNNNQLFKLQDRIFDKCTQLNKVDFSNNQLAKIPRRLFKKCINLFEIDFSNNRIKTFHDDLLSSIGYVQSFNFEKNNIEAISFCSLRPLSECSDINFMDNFLYNSKSLYSSMFQIVNKNPKKRNDQVVSYLDKYTNLAHSTFCIFRNFDKSVVEKCFLAFYLSSSSKTYKSINSLQIEFEKFLVSELSLLDLFISVFDKIDNSKIINLKKHIDTILKDTNLENIEFLIRSEQSISKLCTRNIACHFETFFPNTFNELLSRVRQTNTKSEDFKSEEEKAFNSFCKYVAIKKESSKIIFHTIEYTECFNIALKNKNLEIAKFVVILLRYYVMVWYDLKNAKLTQKECLTDSDRVDCFKKAQDALNKFNRNLFLKFEYIFENDLNEIVMFLMDIKKLDLLKPKPNEIEFHEKIDQLKPEQNKVEFHEKLDQLKQEQNKIEFLEYDLDRFNSKQKAADRIERPKVSQKKAYFLHFIVDNKEILKHESVKQMLTKKWREKEAIQYYFDLLVFIVFVVFFTIYIESEGKTDQNTALQQSAQYISLIIACINLLLEVFQWIMHIVYRKFKKYMSRYVLQIKERFIHFIFAIYIDKLIFTFPQINFFKNRLGISTQPIPK